MKNLKTLIANHGHKLLLLVVLLSVVVFSSIITRCTVETQQAQHYKEAKEVLHSRLQKQRDQANVETAKRKVLEMERESLLSMLADSSSKITQLQSVVRRAGPKVTSATVAAVHTKVNVSVPAQASIAIASDTTKCPELAFTGDIDTEWVKGSVYADKDSIHLRDLLVRNEFEVWQREERAGLFKPLQPVVYFRSLNPYTSIADIQTFAVKPKSKPKVVKVLNAVVTGLAIYGAANLAVNLL